MVWKVIGVGKNQQHKVKLLLTLPRSGSHWVQSYLHLHNIKFNNVSEYNLQEFFKLNLAQPQQFAYKSNKAKEEFQKILLESNIDGSSSVTEKMKFIWSEQDKNRHYSICVMVHQVFLDIGAEKLFNHITRNYDIVTLVRKDLWKACLSELIQKNTEWNHSHHITGKYHKKNLLEKIKNKITIKNYHNEIINYMLCSLILNNINTPYKLYYEDLSDEFLAEYFHAGKDKKIHKYHKFNINYEKYVKNINEIKEFFNKVKKSIDGIIELQNYVVNNKSYYGIESDRRKIENGI